MVHKGHFHIPAGMVVRGERRQYQFNFYPHRYQLFFNPHRYHCFGFYARTDIIFFYFYSHRYKTAPIIMISGAGRKNFLSVREDQRNAKITRVAHGGRALYFLPTGVTEELCDSVALQRISFSSLKEL